MTKTHGTQLSAQADYWESVGIYNGIQYDGLYTISNMGAVYSVAQDRNLTPTPDDKGALWVELVKGEASISYLLDRLVLTCFEGPAPYKGAKVWHKNHRPEDCRLKNLAWVTAGYAAHFALGMHLLTRSQRLHEYAYEWPVQTRGMQRRAVYGRVGGGR